MSRLTRFLVLAFAGLLASHLVRAQALQTGTLTGQALLADGSGLPGVTVTIGSPALQGTRTQGTGANGDYVFKFLPPGAYSVTFELVGMQTVQRNATVELGGTARADATLEVTAATEAVTVSGDSLDVEKTAVNETVYDAEFIQSLPTGRRLDQIGSLAPGVTTNTPNAQQLQISGGFAFDNLFLVDGVDVIDNQFGDVTVGIVIEEAIAETQILTSGISAEFGRFSGGVVNAITKSGGNEYHGSFRSDLTNADWRENTPFEDERDVEHTDQIIDIYSGAFGGRIIKDRLWFFAAARYYDVTDQDILPVTATSFEGSDTEYRLEGKLTGQVAQGHSLQLAYTDSEREVFRTSFAQTADLSDPFNEIGPEHALRRVLQRGLHGPPLRFAAVLAEALRLPFGHGLDRLPGLLVHHADAVLRPLRRAVLRQRAGSGGSGQQADLGKPQLLPLLPEGRNPRPEGRRGVVPVDRGRGQLAGTDGVQLPRGLCASTRTARRS